MTAQIFLDMTEAAYRADPCPAPSLTQSHAKLILDRSPKHVWCSHPKLNPNFTCDDDTKFDVGNVAHRLLIGRGKNVEGMPFDDWRTKAAKEAREEAKARGVLAVLQPQYDKAAAMALAARLQIAASDWPGAFTEGRGEVVITWEHNEVHYRTMIDWMESKTRVFDYKSTAYSCAPHDIAERPSMMGWDLQASFHERALDELDPENAGRRTFVYVAQEDEEPYALSIVQISEADLTLGRKKLAMAEQLWRTCIRANHWPAYPLQTVHSHPKPWLETRTLEREIAHHEAREPETFNPKLLMAG